MKLDPRQIDRWTEADVVMELCWRLRRDGWTVRCEVYVPSAAHRSGFMRCDVAIVEADEILFLFEVKSVEPATIFGGSRQRRAYTEAESVHGIPVFFVYGMGGAFDACIAAARALLPRKVAS